MQCYVFDGLDVAILKATNHIEILPKEKHVRSELKFLPLACAKSKSFDVHCFVGYTILILGDLNSHVF